MGNPPWNKPKGGRSTSEASSRSHIEYCEEQEPRIELPFRSPIDQAFIWRSRDFLHESGRLGLILDAKNFFSQEEQSLVSKRQLFTELRARAMLDLFRPAQQVMFPSAEQPAMIFVAENSKPKKGDKLAFASAERSETFRKHGIVQLFRERLNQLPVDRIPHEPNLFKIATYGTARDRAILKGLDESHPPLAEFLDGMNTKFNRGFEKTKAPTPVPAELLGKPMLDDEELDRFIQHTHGLRSFQFRNMGRARDPSIYEAPLFLAERSLQQDRLVGAICESEVIYSRNFFGIPFKQTDKWRLDLVNAYINSSLATYCFFLTATTFGIQMQIARKTILIVCHSSQ